MPEHVLLAIKKFFICLSGEFLSHSLLKGLSLFVSLLSHTQPDHLNKTEFCIHSRQGFLPKSVPPFSPPTHFLIYRPAMKTQKKSEAYEVTDEQDVEANYPNGAVKEWLSLEKGNIFLQRLEEFFCFCWIFPRLEI